MQNDTQILAGIIPWRTGLVGLIGILAGLILTGCASVSSHPYAPKFPIDQHALIEMLEWKYIDATWWDTFDTWDPDRQKRERDDFLGAMIVLSDLGYYQFEHQLLSGVAAVESAFDLSALASTTATAIVGGEAVKTILAALSTGLLGTQQVLGRRFLADRQISALVLQMRTLREQQLMIILAGMQQPIDQYSLMRGLIDVVRYIHDGSLSAAIAEATHQAARVGAVTREQRLRQLMDPGLQELPGVPMQRKPLW